MLFHAELHSGELSREILKKHKESMNIAYVNSSSYDGQTGTKDKPEGGILMGWMRMIQNAFGFNKGLSEISTPTK